MGDMDAFNKAFDEAWYDLTTTYGSGTWADNAKCDDGKDFPESLRNVKDPDVSKYATDFTELYGMLGNDVVDAGKTAQSNVMSLGFASFAMFIAVAFAAVSIWRL